MVIGHANQVTRHRVGNGHGGMLDVSRRNALQRGEVGGDGCMEIRIVLTEQRLTLLENMGCDFQREPGERAANIGNQARVVKTRFGHVSASLCH